MKAEEARQGVVFRMTKGWCYREHPNIRVWRIAWAYSDTMKLESLDGKARINWAERTDRQLQDCVKLDSPLEQLATQADD